jgi:hypothetical protein
MYCFKKSHLSNSFFFCNWQNEQFDFSKIDYDHILFVCFLIYHIIKRFEIVTLIFIFNNEIVSKKCIITDEKNIIFFEILYVIEILYDQLLRMIKIFSMYN